MAERTWSSRFGGIFPLELHIVEARRRRYRIERTLGFIPEPPRASKPVSPPPKPAPASGSGSVSDETMKNKIRAVEQARKDLAKVRHPQADEATAQAPPGPAAADAAKAYYQAARDWYDHAQRHLEALLSASVEERRRAEAILRVAAAEMADAATEVRRERCDLPAPAGTFSGDPCEEVRGLYALILGYEEDARWHIDAICSYEGEQHDLQRVTNRPAPENAAGKAARRNRQEVAKAFERLSQIETDLVKERHTTAELLLELAPAEKALFEAAARLFSDESPDKDRRDACLAAASAAEEEVQRRRRELNRLKEPPESPPESPRGGLPPQNPCRPGPSPSGGGAGGTGQAGPANTVNHTPGPDLPSDGPLALSREEALDQDLVGLALSGGGIRSATFALGVLQGLAQLRLLGMFDYLSTVSGGGYIGAWLAAWVQREGSLSNVERQLSPNRLSQAGAERFAPDGRTPLDNQPRDEEPEPVHHLRAYSRYLSPRTGLFSPDTWTLFAITLRNLFVNTLFFLPLAVAVVFWWRLLIHGFDAPLGLDAGPSGWPGSEAVLTLRCFLTALLGLAYWIAIGCMAWEEENLFESDLDRKLRDGRAVSPWVTHLLFLFPGLLVALIGPWIFSLDPDDPNHLRYFGESWRTEGYRNLPAFVQFAVSFLVLSLFPSLVIRFIRWARRVRVLWPTGWPEAWLPAALEFLWRTVNLRGLFASLLLAGVFGLCCCGILQGVIWPLSNASAPPWGLSRHAALCLLQSVGVPLMFGAVVLSGWTEMAVLGYWFTEYEREWRARVGAYLMMGAVAWLVVAGAVYLLPLAGELAFDWLRDTLGHFTPEVAKGVLTAGWAIISGSAAWLAGRGVTEGKGKPSAWWVRPLLTIGPAVFLIGLLAGVSAGGEWVAGTLEALLPTAWTGIGDPSTATAAGAVTESRHLVQAVEQPAGGLVLFACSFLLFFVFGSLISVNHFSLHMLYANRLTRCYLGASCRKQRGGSRGTPTGVRDNQPLRQADLFTGFDPWDDIPLSDLRTVGRGATWTGPVPLINCALNCLAGDELAYQDRRADAFLMTPDWCGGALTGYARTPRGERDRGNLTLGRVMTVSGAAVDPNMAGLSPPLTALMTLFNTRLGWWLENPQPDRRPLLKVHRRWAASEPGLGLRLLWEFLGWTNEDAPYVHVSDGGHFENLGVYELIRRRCRFVVVVDAGTDRVAASDNMAAMLRLVRTDFGIRIELDTTRLQLDGANGYSPWHCCVGRIRYDEVDEQAVPGLMVYLQATLSGDEPPDLLQYASRHPAFPRQSTLNQFFDEAQFEAYRTLGHHTALQVFGEAAPAWVGAAPSAAQHRKEVRDVFARLRGQWIAPLGSSTTEWLTAAQLALQLEQRFAGNRNLTAFGHRLYPEVNGGTIPPRQPVLLTGFGSPLALPSADRLPEFRAVSQTLQVMETAWAAMRLNGFHAHPSNRGWMNTFRRWTGSPDFQRWWPVLRAEYSRPFVRFCEEILNLQAPEEPVELIESLQPPPSPLVELDRQFSQEWGDLFAQVRLPAADFPPTGFLTATWAQTVASPLGPPLAWLIGRRQVGGAERACGLACVAGTASRLATLQDGISEPGDAEFFFWLCGCYRSMGVGRAGAAEILRSIDRQAALSSWGASPIRRLVTYYPLREATAGCRLELERWTNFFFDLGFRRRRQPERGVGSQFVVLDRQVG
jgi:hypothetical protein